MDKIRCINCSKAITGKDLKGNTKEVKDKVKIVFRNVAKSKTENTPLCCDCHSTFNTLFNARLTFCSRTDPDSKINEIRYGKRNDKIGAICSRNENDVENLQTTGLIEEETEENEECILPFIDEEDLDDPMSEIICLSEDFSNDADAPVPLIEFQEKFLRIKIEKLPERTLLLSNFSNWTSTDRKRQCLECGRLFATEEFLKNHQSVAHNEQLKYSFECNFCEGKFVHYWFYKNHLDSYHNGIQILFSCILCEKRFKTQKELDGHRSTSHRWPFKCKYCPQFYENVEGIILLRKHLIEFHETTAEAKAAAYNEEYIKNMAGRKCRKNGNPPCFECGEMFENPLACFVHVIFNHFNQINCPVCKEEFLCSNDMKNHALKFSHDLNTCTLCDKKFSNLLVLQRHMYAVHAKYNVKSMYPFICESCGKGFRYFNDLRLHYRRHFRDGDPSYICTFCNKIFVRKDSLKSHMATHHKPHSPNDQEIKCNICKKICYGQSELDLHNSKEHEVLVVSSLHKCPECDFTTKANKGISTHRRIHFEANSTKKATVLMKRKNGMDSEYIEILKSATDGEKRTNESYKCLKCNKVLSTSNHMLLHLYTEHSIVLPSFKKSTFVKCKYCDKLVLNQAQLKKHISSEHPKPGVKQVKKIHYTCHLCLNVEEGIGEMRNHFNTAHPDTEEADISAKNELRHQEDVKGNEKQRTCSQTDIYCVYCQVTFSSITETDNHNKTVHKAQPVCKLCHHVCEDEISYKQHEATHTEFPCTTCNSSFSSMQTFCNHLEDIHKRYPYICEFCRFYISTSEILMKHYERKHSSSCGKKTFLCLTID